MAINIGDNFSYQGKKYLDGRQSFDTLSEMNAYTNVPDGFIAYCKEDKKRYEYVDGVWVEYTVSATVDTTIFAEKTYVDDIIRTHHHDERYLQEHQDISHLATKEEIEAKGYLTEHQDISHLATKEEIPSLEGLVTSEELESKGYLTEHQDISHLATKEELEGIFDRLPEQEIDTSNLATKEELNTKFDDVEVNEEETTDSQTALDFFANGEKVKTVYFSGGGGGGGGAAAYISTTLPEEAMVETGYDFDILLDFYSPNPGKGTLKVFVNDVDALSTPITQGETTTTLSHEKLTKGTNKIVVYVLDRIGTMSNSLTFYVRYGSTELVGEFDSSLSYDYGANIRYYFTATALDTSLGLTFYMSIDGAVQNGVSCISDVRGYFTFPNSLEAGGHYCECWVEDSKGGKSNVEAFNLVILDTNTLAIVTETRNPSVEEGSQLVLDYRVYKKNETTFIIKTYVDEELVSTGTCGLTTSYYKTTTLREGMHNIKIEAWDMTETVSDYITWSVIITPSTYTMLEPINAGSMFIATAKNRTNGDPNRETWTGYNQDNDAIDCTLYNFAFNSESGWMDDQLFITGNSYVEVPIQPLANNARYGFTLDIEFLTKPIGVDDAEVLSLWNDTDNCGIKITTDQLILQSKTGNKCELYFSENEIVSAIFIIDRHEKTAKVYLNGVMCAAFALSDYTAEGVSYLEDFTVNNNLYLGKPGSNGYATIKNLRIYELALSSSEILNNFMANEIDKAKQKALVEFQKGADLPTVTVYCDFSGLGKDDKKYCDIVYNSPDPVKYGESFSLMGKYSQLQYQGTSSMQYPIKNYRLNPKDKDGKVKIKLPNCQPETRFTLKADFMSSGHWQNTGLTKWINENLYNYKEDDPKTMNPAKWWAIQNGKDPNDYRECIYGFPCRLILVNDGNSPLNEGQQEPTPGNTKDMGIFNFNLDKDCENSLGFKIKDFPNALSMEVTANSDTSAGAFMTFKERRLDYIAESCWGAKNIITDYIPVNEWEKWMVGELKSEGGYTDNTSWTILATFDGEYNDLNSRVITENTKYVRGRITHNVAAWPENPTEESQAVMDAFANGDLSVNGNKLYLQLVYNHVSVYAIDYGRFFKRGIYEDDEKTLAYIKESFELRYPDEDDVSEGWGFMGIEEPYDIPTLEYKWASGGITTDYVSIDPSTFIYKHPTSAFMNLGIIRITGYNADYVQTFYWDSRTGSFDKSVTDDTTYITYTFYNPSSYTDDTVDNIMLNLGVSFNGVPYKMLLVEEVTKKGVHNTIGYRHTEGSGLKALIDWVDNSTDEQFVAEFEEHFHKDYTLRYFLLVMVLGMVDNLGKNMMLDSYDGKIWMPRFYDCDTICSYDNSGAIKFDVDIEMEQGYWNTSSSRLWTRVRDLLHDELVVKYNDMRQNGLSFESLMSVFYDEQIAKIPQKYYNMDADVKYLPYADEYLGKAHGDGYEHLKRWLKNRIIFTDSLYDYAPSYTNDMITFRANTTEEMTITIETYTPVYQHVSWYNGNMQKEKIAKGTQLTFKGFAQAATDQEVLVYGGSNIKRIIGISTMNPNSMLIGNATRLVELDISDCPILTDINSNKANFTPHTYLNKLDISNCPQLGGSLRLNYSPLIGEINAMNTAITDLQLPSSIRNLHTLKIPGALTNLTLNDGPVLSTLEFDGPNNLQSVNLTNCNALTNVVNFDMTQIPSVTLNNSYDADELYMSKTTNLSLVNMANIKKLIFVPNNEHKTFNLTQLRNYPDYTISAINCPSLKTFITTAPYRDSYKNGGYGEVTPNTAFCANTLDISNTKITDVNFLCTTDVYQLKLPDTVNNFICDSAYDLDTDYLQDGDFDTVHHELIEAYTTNHVKNTYRYEDVVDEYLPNDPRWIDATWYDPNKGTFPPSTAIHDTVTDWFEVCPGTSFTLDAIEIRYSCCIYEFETKDGECIKSTGSTYTPIQLTENTHYVRCYAQYGKNSSGGWRVTYTKARTPNLIPSAADGSLIFSMYAPNTNVAVPAEGIWDLYGLTFEEFYTYGMNNDVAKNIAPETTIPVTFFNGYDREYTSAHIDVDDVLNDGVITVRMNDAIEGALLRFYKDDTRLTDVQFYTTETIITPPDEANKVMFFIIRPKGTTAFPTTPIIYLNNAFKFDINVVANSTDLKVPIFEQEVIVTMHHRYADYNVTIQNANIKPTNHPTMLYPLLVNENKPIVGTIDYSDYQGDDLSYAMAYANKSEVDISIPNDVAMNTQYFYDIDKESEYEYNDPRTIAKYTCNAKGVLPTFNSGYSGYSVTERDNGDGTYITKIMSNLLGNLPSSISFKDKTELLSVDYLNTTNLTDMDSMFYNCTGLTSLDLSNWDTSSVTNISNMFYRCSSLTSLDLSGWDTSSVAFMYGVFNGCSNLTSLDLSNWDTSSVTNMDVMFQNCSKLTSLDLSSFDTSKVTNMGSMFKGCSTLEDLDISTWKFDSLEKAGGNGAGMFYDCKALKSDKFPVFDIPKVNTATRMFFGCYAITELHFRNTNKIQSMNDGYSNGAFINSSSLVRVTGIDFSGLTRDSTNFNSIDIWGPIEEFTITGNIYKSITIKMDNAPYSVVKGILNALANVGDDTKTLVISQYSIELLSESDIIAANNKGWTITGRK